MQRPVFTITRLYLLVSFALFLGCSSASSSGPNAETLKQALTAKLMRLKPSGMTERQVIYQNVRSGSAGNFKVTAQIRDYGPGYPPNHYYGETCIGRFEDQVFTLAPDGFGGFDVQGALTPDKRDCKPNPSAGASSIPLSSLSGTQASAGTPQAPAENAKAPAAAGTGKVRTGSYECWAFSQARMGMNFTILDGSRYKDSEGKSGTYSVDANSRIAFHGGMLDGVMPPGFYAVYYVPQGRPTVSFRSQRSGGAEASFCQWVK